MRPLKLLSVIQCLSYERILELHELAMAATGDVAQVVRSESPVRAALERACWGPFEAEGDLAERAALLLRGIAQEHPFVDGNKRTSLAVVETFLRLNGVHLRASQDDLVEFVLRVALGELEVREIALWIRAQVTKG